MPILLRMAYFIRIYPALKEQGKRPPEAPAA
jgi:hypothetical protein